MTTLSRPYPERIAELERENAGLKRRVDSISEYSRAHHADRIAELERLLESTRQQYVDADHALRIRDDECRKLRSEASELMAENAGLIQVNDQLKRDKAWLNENAKQQAERIRGLEAEVESLTAHSEHLWSGLERALDRIRVGNRPSTGQADLPPTRAEEQGQMDEILRQQRRDAEKRWPNRIANEANEEREG